MDWLLLAAAGAVLFMARDAALLSATRPGGHMAFAAWAVVQALLFASLGIAAESLSRDAAYAILRDPRFWIPAAAIHAAIWAILFAGRRSAKLLRNVWMVALAPAPVFVFCAGALVWATLTRANFPGGWVAGAAVGAVWIASVRGIAAVRRSTPETALQFAATANLSAILLIPIQQQSGESSAVAEESIDWIAALLPLAVTASLVLLSFLFHRHRSARRSA